MIENGRKPIVGMSLKMYKPELSETLTYVQALVEALGNETKIEKFIFPGMGLEYPVGKELEGTEIGFGSQDISDQDRGPYTGEYSVKTLKSMGGRYAEIGHAERRKLYKETDQMISNKVRLCLENNIKPVLCIGEPMKESKTKAVSFLKEQMQQNIPSNTKGLENIILAYEPVWAIGAEDSAEADYVHFIAGEIRKILKENYGESTAEAIRIIYGGSVSKNNVQNISRNQNIDGVFVGRFGHDVKNFAKIVETAKEMKL